MLPNAPLAGRAPLAGLAWAIAAGVVALQLVAATRYGIFRDEYYYLLCADHLAWGYVDHPPLSIALLRICKSIFGDGQLVLRIAAALLHGLVVLGTAALAREFRGRRIAQALAAIVAALAPGILALGGFYSMNILDVALWIGAAWITCRLLDGADRRWWWGLGAIFGLGMLNKYSMLFLGAGLAIGLALSPLRRELRSRQLLTALAIAGLIFLPHLAWQFAHGWPSLEFIRNARDLKNAPLGPFGFWAEQILLAHPLYLPLAILGMSALLVDPKLRTWRPLGVAFLVVAAWLTFSRAKPYYLTPAYPMVFAAGAVALCTALQQWPRLARVRASGLLAVVIVAGLALAPMAIPLLEPAAYIAYERILRIRPADAETAATAELPQHFADRFGWPELARAVGAVVQGLPPAERDSVLILADNYGQCGALNYHGRQSGLPPAVSGHNSCFSWFELPSSIRVAVVIGGQRAELERLFADVEQAGTGPAGFAMPYERDLPLWVCREPRQTWAQIRAGTRSYI